MSPALTNQYLNKRRRCHIAHLRNNSHSWSEKLQTNVRVLNTKYLDNLVIVEYILFVKNVKNIIKLNKKIFVYIFQSKNSTPLWEDFFFAKWFLRGFLKIFLNILFSKFPPPPPQLPLWPNPTPWDHDLHKL